MPVEPRDGFIPTYSAEIGVICEQFFACLTQSTLRGRNKRFSFVCPAEHFAMQTSM